MVSYACKKGDWNRQGDHIPAFFHPVQLKLTNSRFSLFGLRLFVLPHVPLPRISTGSE